MENATTENKKRLQFKRWFWILSNALPSRSISSKDIFQDREFLDFVNVPNSESLEPNSESLQRTIRRDLQALCEMGYIEEIRLDRKNNEAQEYRSTRDKNELSLLLKLKIDPYILQSILLSQDIFQYFNNTELQEAMKALYTDVHNIYHYDDKASAVENVIKVKHGAQYEFDKQGECLDSLINACRSHDKVKIKYRTVFQKTGREDTVHPYKLILYKESFYLLCYKEHNYYKLRGFRLLNLIRFEHVKLTGETFNPKIEEVEKELKKIDEAFGILTYGDEVLPVRIVFKKGSYVEKLIREKKWHTSSEFSDQPEGVVLTMNVLVNEELARWVLGWGKDVISVEPESLLDAIRNIAKNDW